MSLLDPVRTSLSILTSGAAGLRESFRDVLPHQRIDPGIDHVVDACANWLLAAQENSASRDGGVASHYCYREGWADSYPETTGYIVPTLLEVAALTNRADCSAGALRMLNWLESIQLSDGSFQGGNVRATPCVPVVFNTGQILFGLVAGVTEWGDAHVSAAQGAADWLLKVQDPDGAWRQYRSPFTSGGPKTYETHVAWALLLANQVLPDRGYAEAGMKNIYFAVSRQSENGWFDNCSLAADETPITHTLGYALRGIIEGWRYSGDQTLLEAARKTADSICIRVRADGWLAGMFDRHWNPTAKWVCLTGSAQLAHCLILLSQDTGVGKYLDVARRLNRFVRTTIQVEGGQNLVGGVKGSFPVYGRYGPYRLLNWAVKFTIDANLAEREVAQAGQLSQASMIATENAAP